MVFCSSCGKEVGSDQNFCPSCGKPVSSVSAPNYQTYRPTGITILGILEIISGIIFVIAAIMMGAIAGMGGHMGGMLGGVMGTFGGILAAILALGAVFSFLIAGALFSGKRWGRTITIVFSIISLIIEAVSLASGNPFAIASVILNIIILWYMWRPHVIAYFNK